MHDKMVGCCNERSCWTMPLEFVRMRYFYGQRLGVMELSDQASYHAGKHAFHNARLHGIGVLCGLSAERYVFVPATTTTVLRVARGAALDACGREVIAGADQCVDLVAWYAKNRARADVVSWVAGADHQLVVAIRYRDCPSDPAPAPRDPCGCDQNGCEFGRVREGFELALLLPTEHDKLLTRTRPSPTDLAAAFSAGSLEEVNDRVAALVARACPEPGDGEGWLALATITVAIDSSGALVDITAIDNAPPERLSLLPTQALQTLIVDAAAALASSGSLGTGPTYGALRFAGSNATDGILSLAIHPATMNDPPVVAPLVDATFDPSFVRLQRLDPITGWADVTPAPGDIRLDTAATPPRVLVAITGVDPTMPYRLTITSPAASPLSDVRGRAIAPATFSRSFGFVLDGTTLTLAAF